MVDADLDRGAEGEWWGVVHGDEQERLVQLDKESAVLGTHDLAADNLPLSSLKQAQQPEARALALAAAGIANSGLGACRYNLKLAVLKQGAAVRKVMLDLVVHLEVRIAPERGGRLGI